MQQAKLYEEMLINRKTEIIKILDDLKNEFKDVSSCDIKEEADFASCSSNNENNLIIYKKLQQELNEIDDAIEALKRGEYGICKMCEEPINPERLAIKPFAKYCIDCREIIEKESKSS
jgi:DnaK suppressor protein